MQILFTMELLAIFLLVNLHSVLLLYVNSIYKHINRRKKEEQREKISIREGVKLTMKHHLWTVVIYLLIVAIISGWTFEADSFNCLIFTWVSSSSLFTVVPELPLVCIFHQIKIFSFQSSSKKKKNLQFWFKFKAVDYERLFNIILSILFLQVSFFFRLGVSDKKMLFINYFRIFYNFSFE